MRNEPLTGTRQPADAEPGFAFFTGHEARTIEAAMARIFPDDKLGPGAIGAGAVHYLDRALAGAEQHNQRPYRAGVLALDRLARARFRAEFATCAPAQQDAIIGDLAADAAPEFGQAVTGLEFFELLRTHTIEGVFSDPVHGGNRNLSGWKLLGYQGPQPSYSHEEQQLDAVVRRDRIYTAADYPLAAAEEPE